MSEEKRMPVLTGQKKQIFYTGLVYLLVCFMTAGVTVFLTKEKKDEVKEVDALISSISSEIKYNYIELAHMYIQYVASVNG